MANTISYTSANILFTATDGTALPGKYFNGNNDYEDFDGKVRPFVNAVEIDWNNAQLGSTSINTTGELYCSMVVPMGYRRFAII